MGGDYVKTENWNGHEIRFVWYKDEWWAVAKDIAEALELKDGTEAANMVDDDEKALLLKRETLNPTITGLEIPNRGFLILSETGIYEVAFNSKKPEAKQFKKWVKQIIKTLRQSTGLEGFEIFKLLDKEHQKEAMAHLANNLKEAVKVDYIKANTIANKAVSIVYGYAKMVKKEDMSPEMLVDRRLILKDTVELMTVNAKHQLGLSVSNIIYAKYCYPQSKAV